MFAKVVEANSFSEAARRLKVPVSTVSRRIAELENAMGVRLLERSTRSLRLTEVGAEVLEQAERSAELSDTVDSIVSDHRSHVSGLLRFSSPPSLSDTLLAPLTGAFQAEYPEVRVQAFVTERFVDPIAEGVDIAFRIGVLKDSTLVARKLLRYRHQLVASPEYLANHPAPKSPRDLLRHRLLGFARSTPENSWSFVRADGTARETVRFQPSLAMNDYAGLAQALVMGAGIGDLPPLVQPALLKGGRLVEVMPRWHLRTVDLSMVHLGRRHIPRAVRAFLEFAVVKAPALFDPLPT